MQNKHPRLLLLAMAAILAGTSCSKNNNISPDQDGQHDGDSRVSTEAITPTPHCIAYVEVNDNALKNAGCFTLSNGKPVVNTAVIFAGNINYYTNPSTGAKNPVVKLNAQVTYLLTKTTYVQDLKNKGIKVTLSLLNNHDGSGWSSFKNQTEIDYFARSVKKTIETYGLDGIEIDDEYSGAASATVESAPKAIDAIRKLLPNIIIGHYLFSDKVNPASVLAYKFADGRKFADMIDYALPDYNVNPDNYLSSIAKNKLFFSRQANSSSIQTDATKAKNNSYAGVMLFNVTSGSTNGMLQVAKGFYGTSATVTVPSGCNAPWDRATIEKGPETYVIP